MEIYWLKNGAPVVTDDNVQVSKEGDLFIKQATLLVSYLLFVNYLYMLNILLLFFFKKSGQVLKLYTKKNIVKENIQNIIAIN